MYGIGTTEVIIIAAIVLLIFGPKKIPEIARSIGEAIRSIRGISSAAGKDIDKTDTNS